MKKRLMGLLFGMVVGVAVLACSAVVLAQTAAAQAIPRTPDGKPDLSGTWFGGGRTTGGQAASQFGGMGTMELTKWGNDKFNWNRAPAAANTAGVYRGQHVRVDQDPLYHCYPAGLVRLGPPRYIIIGGSSADPALIEILQTPSKVILLFNYQHEVRQIFTDGREHPKNLELTWNGHSIGRWDGDTLVVDTIGIRDESWLDSGGHEHSTQLHIVERIRRVDADTLEIERTLTDPIALAEPFTTGVVLKLSPARDMDENIDGAYDCTQFMMRKSAFGEGVGGVMGISEPPAGGY